MYPDGLERPRLKAHLTVRIVHPDRVFLLAEGSNHLVRGVAAVAIAPYLDGRHTVPEIASAVGDRVALGDCLFALAKYEHFGHLAEGLGAAIAPAVAAAWDARGIDPAQATRHLSNATVALAAVGEVALAPQAGALTSGGLRVREVPWSQIASDEASIAVVLTDEYLDPRLGEIDTAMRAAGRSWLLARPVGAEIWLGPYFGPESTGCWHCLHERLDGNRPVGQYLRHGTGDPAPPRTSVEALPNSVEAAAHLVAGAAVTGVVTGGLPALADTLVVVDTLGLGSERHRLVRQPQCAGCGDPKLMHRPPRIELASRPVAFFADGGYRTEPPQVTYRRLEKHIGPILGAVSALRPLAGIDGGLVHSYAAGHNFAVQGGSIDGLRRTLRGQSGGKGRTELQAKVSAVCEALERYSGVWRPSYPATVSRLADLGPDRAVDVADLLLFSDAQYAGRESWNHSTAAGRLHIVPTPLDPSRPISWTSGWSLTDERERLVPSAYTWFGHPDLYERPFCFPDANGNAAGNTVEEAILQGFCELVERDSVALWWYNRARRPALDLDSLADPYVDALRDLYAAQGRELWVLDVTADLGVPAFVAVSRRADHPVEDVLLGFGAHLDARLAALRALTELNQFLPAVTNRHPDGTTDYWENDPATLGWWRDTRTADERWLRPDPDAVPTTISGYGARREGDLADDVRRCVELARDAELEVIVCDQTRPDLELSVVKVIVPGLRHFWRRLAPGRLYDVPARLGWVARPMAEGDANPTSVFF